MICVCEGSPVFPRCQKEFIDCEREGSTGGYSTGKWSDDDDMHPTITPFLGRAR
jgi:hypothetical protein